MGLPKLGLGHRGARAGTSWTVKDSPAGENLQSYCVCMPHRMKPGCYAHTGVCMTYR